MNNKIILITKDCMSLESLPVYGNTYWNGKTPNIDALAAKGTVYKKHYCTAPSTTMSVSAMLSGHYPYEFSTRKTYTDVAPSEFPSVYDYFQKNGYETHLIWDKLWTVMTWSKIREFGDETKTILHELDICQRTGSGKETEDEILKEDGEKLKQAVEEVSNELKSIDFSKKQFVWLHLPHVLKGRTCYMSDMDAFDRIVGVARELFGDDNIIISTDHGHMNMHKGLVGYGFDVYEPAIHIPLITPRFSDKKEINYLTSNVDLHVLLCENRELPQRDYVVSETQYYWQENRKTAIVTDKYKYIFNKIDRSEELYDLSYDSDENYNILVDSYFDNNRKKKLFYNEYYFYPYKDEALKELKELRLIKDSFWLEPSKKSILYSKISNKLPLLTKTYQKIKK